jgi:class 3 adenylate cyclase/tetratricopeptide (TPR) repeat protein
MQAPVDAGVASHGARGVICATSSKAVMIKCPSCGEENPPKFRLCGYCGAPLAVSDAAAPHEVRKTVTLIFCDIKDSTRLGEHVDAEALHEIKDRYFAAMAGVIQRHGGRIEKYIGDAIMAVFGLPRAHEDDALRAVRAALGMQLALASVNEDLQRHFGIALANRIGVNTGEVVANDTPGVDQKLATGDAVNVAARLEAAAPANGIYLGALTHALVREAVIAEAVEPLELKGKAQRVPAYRLLSFRTRGDEDAARRRNTSLVGRDDELLQLRSVYREVQEGRCVRLVTVLGDAGAGKSRLLQEIVDEAAAAQAVVLRGRCLPYGDGITFWPLREMVGMAAGIRGDDAPEAARAKMHALLGDADLVERLAFASGLSKTAFPLHELYWSARKFLERCAATRPLVVQIDDIHWAEPAFLDLLEHVLEACRDAPILLLATARHELLDERPQWGEGPCHTRLALGPLSDSAAAQIASSLLGDAALPPEVVARTLRAAEGNPLYVEQWMSMLVDSGALRRDGDRWTWSAAAGEITVPPTIRALLEARIDQLARSERVAVEPAAVIGLEFAQPGVEALVPATARAGLSEQLLSLTRRQFIHPAVSTEAHARYRFHHQLVRDTVYNGLLKRTRATLHAEFVRWADQLNADRDRALEFEEILGYHLEQAHRLLAELGPLDDQGRALGSDAARRLSSAGRRALARGDFHAAANLLERAIALQAHDDPRRVELLPELAETCMGMGDFTKARTILDEARASAERTGNRRMTASARLVTEFVHLYSGDPGGSEEKLKTAHELIPLLERENAHSELATAWRLIMLVHGIAGRYSLATAAAEHSITHARRAGNDRLVARVGGILSNTALLGPTPVPEAIAQCEQLIAAGLSDRQVECSVMCTLAQLRAMNGELQAARVLYQRGRAMLRDLGHHVNAAATGLDLARVEFLGGDLGVAERELRADYEMLANMGETYYLSSMAALLSRVLRDQGKDDEALALSVTAEQASAEDDLESQSMWRAVRAPIVARAGDTTQAEGLARDAVAFARRTEATGLQADALLELACVLRIARQPEARREALGEAIALYSAKGNIVSAARASRAAAESIEN